MKKANRRIREPHANDPDNIEFLRLINELAGFGLSQLDVAGLLDVSQGQLSRVKKGERHAAWKHVRTLREHVAQLAKDQRNKLACLPSRQLAAIDHGVLKGLSAKSAVEAFRDLLWARATDRGMSVTDVSVSSDITTADGGIDASVTGDGFTDDELLSSGRRFQIKTGDFEPWQMSSVNRELFGTKAAGFENLGAAVQRMLTEGNSFVVVCFGKDPVDEKLRRARRNFADAFAACGYPDARVDVWGQNKLIGLFQQYPALCLRLRGLDQEGFRFWESWSADAEMLPAVHYSEKMQQLIDDLRCDIELGRFAHIRLIGEPGVGKSRLALEITRAANIAPLTLYLRDGQSLLRSAFLNELVQGTGGRFVVLVVDECPVKDSAEIWNILKTRSERVRLVTIDHGPDTSADEKLRVVNVSPSGPEEIAAILREYGVDGLEANRWAEYCEGSPRFAHMVGENLRQNRFDVLQPPATANVYERSIVGRDDANSEKVQLRKTVLRHVALFERFGFAPPVEEEARFISELAQASDPRLTWPRFQEVVSELRERRIIQGTTTLYITPRVLQIHLYHDFWHYHGNGFDIAGVLHSMPPELQPWFIAMLKFLGDSSVEEAAINRLLNPSAVKPDESFRDSDELGRLLMALAESRPKATVKTLQRVLATMGTEQLKEIRVARQQLVWALERISVWEDCFSASAELLLKLAEAENSTYGNNATGTFVQLFGLAPGMAATQASASHRIAILRDVLDSESAERRRIGLAAAQSALSTGGGTRLVGPEHQGLRKQIDFWFPETYEELWQAYQDVWEMVTAKLDTWMGEERRRLVQGIIKCAGSLLHVAPLRSMALTALEDLANDEEADLKDLLVLVQRELKYRRQFLSDDAVARLDAIRTGLDGHDFRSNLRRYVKYATMEDAFDDGDSRSLDRKLDQLADEAASSLDSLAPELPWLVCEESNPAHYFGIQVGLRDPHREFLPTILGIQQSGDQSARLAFTSGYVAAIFKNNVQEWESLILSLAEQPYFRARIADLVISTGMSDTVARKIVELCRAKSLELSCLERWWFANQLREINEPVFLELVELQVVELWTNSVQMFHTYYIRPEHQKTLPEHFTYRLLTAPAMNDDRRSSSISFYWSQLAARFLESYPHRKWEFFQAIMRAGTMQWTLLCDLELSNEQVLAGMLKDDPQRAWDSIASVLADGNDGRSFGIRRWLDGGLRGLPGSEPSGLIQYVPSDKLFSWVDENVEEHGHWLADTLAKTLDQSAGGRLTRNFLAKYGKCEAVSRSLWCRFRSRGWCGPASDHYRKLRETAREWLAKETNQTVVRWVEDYIDGLGRDIERAEIEEERRGF